MAVTKVSGGNASTRDLADAKTRAALLGALAAHREKFSAAERASYDAFRDECVKIARRTGSTAKAAEALALLLRFLEEKSALAKTSPAADAPASVARPEPVSVAEAFGVNLTFVPRVRPQKDFDVKIPDSAIPQAPTHAVALEMPVFETAIPESIPIPESAPAPVPAPISEPAPTAVEVPDASVPSTRSSEAKVISHEIEEINAALNEFAHGKAFQWLHDPKTGYRAYMTKLLASREAIDAAQKGGSSDGLTSLPEELRVLANAVRSAVGGEPIFAPSSASATPVPEVAPEKEEVKASLIAPDATSPQNAGTIAVSDLEAPDQGFVSVAPEQTPAAAFISETVAPAFSVPDAPIQDPAIFAPEVKEGLNALLEQWLGGGGWLGLKKGGIEHPDWKKMAPLTVGQVVNANGFVPPGMTHELIENLAANLREWSRLYSISLLQHEETTVEEIMHRIVFASLKR